MTPQPVSFDMSEQTTAAKFEHYKTPPTAETAATLLAMEAKARAPKRAHKKAAKRKAMPSPQPREQHDAHVRAARPRLLSQRATISVEHELHPPLGPDGWGMNTGIQLSSMGEGARPRGTRLG
ncbi:MAG: hypothetical protein CL949_08355 [Erythrobacter sp.]|nr:hypothetical protein [Erythrobacter sp.]